jgi:hypothetical protein
MANTKTLRSLWFTFLVQSFSAVESGCGISIQIDHVFVEFTSLLNMAGELFNLLTDLIVARIQTR